MDVSKMPVSGRVEDRTGWTARQEALHGLLTNLNPLFAMRKTRDVMLERGIIQPPAADLQLGMPVDLTRWGQ